MMDEQYRALLIESEHSPEARRQLQQAMAEDSELAEAVRQWKRARATLRGQLDACLPDREVLVLYALEKKGLDECLSEEERARLRETRAQLEEALTTHPGLRDVVRDVQEACDEFDDMWTAQLEQRDHAPAAEPHSRTDRAPRPSRARQTEPSWTRRLVVGTVLVAVAVAVLFLLPQGAETVAVETQAGEQRVVEWTDGSSVRLVGATHLTYTPASGGESFNRRVTLERGRAFFDVASAASPFVVETPTARATVLGTMFGMQADTEETEVILASGKVAVAGLQQSEQAVVLGPGQASWVRQDGLPSSPTSVDIGEALEWTGLFIFRNTPLRVITQRLSQQYGTAVTVHPDLAAEEITGTFERSRGVEDILRVVATTLNAKVETPEPDTYRIVPEAPSRPK